WAGTAERPYDPPLAQEGAVQASELGRRLAAEKIDHIFSSPFLRCVETVNEVAERLDFPIKLEWGLCEWLNPNWFPSRPETLPFGELASRFPRIDRGYTSRVTTHFPESAEDTFERVGKSARRLAGEYPGNLLLVGHGATVQGAVIGLMQQSFEEIESSGFTLSQITYCCLFKLINQGVGWHMELNGDTSHLTVCDGGIRFH
ncbi:MAG: histidine phosphatase family protein, partial [Acidobacteriota bacterium]